MILNAEQLAEMMAYKEPWIKDGSVRDLLDTISDLQRQLAERDAAVRSLRHLLDSRINNLKGDSEFKVWLDAHDAHIAAESQNELVAAGWLDPEAVQQRVDEAVLACQKDHEIDLDGVLHVKDHCYECRKYAERLPAARSRGQGKRGMPNVSITVGTGAPPSGTPNFTEQRSGKPRQGKPVTPTPPSNCTCGTSVQCQMHADFR